MPAIARMFDSPDLGKYKPRETFTLGLKGGAEIALGDCSYWSRLVSDGPNVGRAAPHGQADDKSATDRIAGKNRRHVIIAWNGDRVHHRR